MMSAPDALASPSNTRRFASVTNPVAGFYLLFCLLFLFMFFFCFYTDLLSVMFFLKIGEAGTAAVDASLAVWAHSIPIESSVAACQWIVS